MSLDPTFMTADIRAPWRPVRLTTWDGAQVAAGMECRRKITEAAHTTETLWSEGRSGWQWECTLDRPGRSTVVDQVNETGGGHPAELVSVRVGLLAGDDAPLVTLTFKPQGSTDPEAARTICYGLGESFPEGIEPGVGDVEAQVVDEQGGHSGPPSQSSVGGTSEGTPRAGRAAPSRPGSVQGGESR